MIIATGAVAKRLEFPGAGDCEGGYWNKGISACAVCDGAAPIFRNRPLAVIGGGDTAMEEASFLTKYGSKARSPAAPPPAARSAESAGPTPCLPRRCACTGVHHPPPPRVPRLQDHAGSCAEQPED